MGPHPLRVKSQSLGKAFRAFQSLTSFGLTTRALLILHVNMKPSSLRQISLIVRIRFFHVSLYNHGHLLRLGPSNLSPPWALQPPGPMKLVLFWALPPLRVSVTPLLSITSCMHSVIMLVSFRSSRLDGVLPVEDCTFSCHPKCLDSVCVRSMCKKHLAMRWFPIFECSIPRSVVHAFLHQRDLGAC